MIRDRKSTDSFAYPDAEFIVPRADHLVLIPTNSLTDPRLSLKARGAAAVMYTIKKEIESAELAERMGITEEEQDLLFAELRAAGYLVQQDGINILQEVY